MIDWTVFLVALLDWLAECLEERRQDEVETDMINGGFRVRRGVMRLLRNQELHGRELREEVDEAMAMLEEMDAEDRACLLEDAEARRRQRNA